MGGEETIRTMGVLILTSVSLVELKLSVAIARNFSYYVWTGGEDYASLKLVHHQGCNGEDWFEVEPFEGRI